MSDRERKQKLADRLIEGGGDPKEARKFAGVAEPSQVAKDIPSANQAESKARKAVEGTTSAGRKVQSAMSAGRAQKWIFGIMIAIVGIQLFNDIIKGRNRQFDVIPRRIFAGSLAGILLMLLAIIAPRIALGLALVMAATTLLVDARASGVLENLTNIARGNKGEQATIPNVTRTEDVTATGSTTGPR